MKIGIIVAMSSELACIRALLQGGKEERFGNETFFTGTNGTHRLILTQSGIGKVNAALHAQTLIRHFAPDCIINTGVAGGIDTSLRVFDTVIGSEVVYHDAWFGEGNAIGQIQGLPPRFAADKELLHKVQAATAGNERIYSGLICSGDRFITDRTELESIKRNFPEGLAVDMESAAIAQTCYLLDTPFISLRIISDTPGVENHFDQYNDFWEKAPEQSFSVIRRIINNI